MTGGEVLLYICILKRNNQQVSLFVVVVTKNQNFSTKNDLVFFYKIDITHLTRHR